MSDSLNGKVVAVTGASSGIGEATAKLVAERGGAVALGARRKDRIDALAQEISSAGGTAVAIETDVTDEASAKSFVGDAAQQLGGLDALVNNAGLMLLGKIEGANTEDWRRMVEVNCLGLLYCTQEAIPLLRERGGGHIVNVSSVAGRHARVGTGAYNLTKFGVTGFTEALRQEGLASNIRVSSVEPGFVDTELQQHNTPEIQELLRKRFEDTGKILEAEDIARAIAYVIEQPEHVNINEVLVRPTGQEF